MNIEIEFAEKVKERQLLDFKNYLSRQRIEGLRNCEVKQNPSKEGEMAVGSVTQIFTGIIDSLNAPLVELVKCLSEYVKLFKTEIKLKNENGVEVSITSAKLSKEEIKNIVEKFITKPEKDD